MPDVWLDSSGFHSPHSVPEYRLAKITVKVSLLSFLKYFVNGTLFCNVELSKKPFILKDLNWESCCDDRV